MHAVAPSNAQTRGYVGSRYQRGRDVTDIAKDIRKDIKESVKAGAIPGAPVKYSVTTSRFSGGTSIEVTIKHWPEPARVWVADETSSPYQGGYRFTSHAACTKAAIEGIVARYHRDNSDSQTDYFDVNFYSSVGFDYLTTPDAEGAR